MAEMPNLSCRMNEVTAAVMRPLIKNLPQRVEAYNRRYDAVVKVLREEAGDVIVVPTQDERVGTVGDHLNFYLTGVNDEQNALFRQTCVAMGVPVSWFQSKVNARWHVNWRKVRLADLRPPEHGRGAALRLRPQDAAVLRRRGLPGLRASDRARRPGGRRRRRPRSCPGRGYRRGSRRRTAAAT